MAGKYQTLVLSVKLTEDDLKKQAKTVAKREQDLRSAEEDLETQASAWRDAKRALDSAVSAARASLAKEAAIFRDGVDTREVKCYRDTVKGKDVWKRAQDDSIVKESEIVSGQQLGLPEDNDEGGDGASE